MKNFPVWTLILLATLLSASPTSYAQQSPELSAPTQTWNFRVYLGEKPIGTHTFLKYGNASDYEMRIEANFRVNFLLFFSYTYEHSNREQWRGGCLQAIESQTDDNGDLYTVAGKREADSFAVVANEKTHQFPACITSFAYWDSGFLNQTALLNSQTGEYMPVKITGPFEDTRVYRGNTVMAQRYRITAKGVDIRLWYSESGDWLALESILESDRTLRYERI